MGGLGLKQEETDDYIIYLGDGRMRLSGLQAIVIVWSLGVRKVRTLLILKL